MKQNRKNKINLLAFFLFLFFFSFTFISGEEFGYNYLEAGENLDQKTYINYTQVNVNASDWWITAEGNLDNVVDILISWITPDDYDMTGYNLTASWFNGKFNWTSISHFLIFDGSSLDYNETALNESIDNRATGLGDNESWNESYADTKYGGGIGNVSWNESYANTVYSINNTFNATYDSYATNVSTNYTEKTVTGYDARWLDGNTSWNESYANTLYLQNNTFNATYDSYSTNVSRNYSENTFGAWDSRWYQVLWDATFNTSLTDFFNTLFGGKTTDDLPEGSSNFYENQSWNESYSNTIYLMNNTFNATYDSYSTNVSLNYSEEVFNTWDSRWTTAGNTSWNESYADTRYSVNNTFNQTYHDYATNVSTNYTEKTVTGYDARWYQVLWDAVFNASFDDRDSEGNVSWNESYANTLYWDIGDGSYNSTYDNYAQNVSNAQTNFTGNVNITNGNLSVQDEITIGVGGICNNGSDMWFVLNKADAIADGDWCT